MKNNSEHNLVHDVHAQLPEEIEAQEEIEESRDRLSAQVIAVVFGKPFERKIGEIHSGIGDVDGYSLEEQRQRAFYVAFDENTGELTTHSFNENGNDLSAYPQIFIEDKSMMERLIQVASTHEPIVGPRQKSSKAIDKLEKTRTEENPLAKRLIKLTQIVNTPGMRERNKVDFNRANAEIAEIMEQLLEEKQRASDRSFDYVDEEEIAF